MSYGLCAQSNAISLCRPTILHLHIILNYGIRVYKEYKILYMYMIHTNMDVHSDIVVLIMTFIIMVYLLVKPYMYTWFCSF